MEIDPHSLIITDVLIIPVRASFDDMKLEPLL